MIEIERNDKDFNLDNISNKDLYEGLKDGIIASNKNRKNFESITEENIRLDIDDCSRTQIIGDDGNLYPQINLSTRIMPNKSFYFPTHAHFLVTPFNIQMVIVDGNGIETTKPEELTSAFIEFMTTTFPESNYLEKKAEYERKSELRKKVYDDMIFGN